MSNNIKFIYFDIGGVLLLDFSGNNKWYEMKRDLGFTDENIPFFDQLWAEHTARVNLDYDIDNFSKVLSDKANVNIPKDYSMLQDFINRFKKNLLLEKIVSSLKSEYNLGLLTNMYPRMLKILNEHSLIPQFKWNAVIDSSVIGYQKPDAQIYEVAEEMTGVNSKDILFIDNMEENLVVPKERGWKTFLYDPTNPNDSAKEFARFVEIEY
jgi:FMN phosphatase YigB (HAD superfamily)